jgi:hypothetical protein
MAVIFVVSLDWALAEGAHRTIRVDAIRVKGNLFMTVIIRINIRTFGDALAGEGRADKVSILHTFFLSVIGPFRVLPRQVCIHIQNPVVRIQWGHIVPSAGYFYPNIKALLLKSFYP